MFFETCTFIKYDKQDQKGKAASNERNPHLLSNKSQWQGAQEDPKQKQDRAQGRARAGQPLKSYIRMNNRKLIRTQGKETRGRGINKIKKNLEQSGIYFP
jgi:hypothetical protein